MAFPHLVPAPWQLPPPARGPLLPRRGYRSGRAVKNFHGGAAAARATSMEALPSPFDTPGMRQRIALIAESHARLTGRVLAGGSDLALALWHAPLAIVAHGTEADPLFFFGNRAALIAFGATPETLVGLPSRYSAEAPDRAERQALLDRVTAHGYVDDYAGVRVRLDGGKFRIEHATVWNLIDAQGVRHGQAAAFAV
jgi:PAS domain-containing protein